MFGVAAFSFVLLVSPCRAAADDDSLRLPLQRMPTWEQWLVLAGHDVEDGRACGLVQPDEVDRLYVAVLMLTIAVDKTDPALGERILTTARNHARDTPVTSEVCAEAQRTMPQLRSILAPYLAMEDKAGK